MKGGLIWLLLVALAGAMGWLLWHAKRKWEERKLAEEARAAAFISGLSGAPKPPAETPVAAMPVAPIPAAPVPVPPGNDIATQKLLFEAAHKAGEAGEPALAIQLYARLLARYPATSFADPARAAAAALKKKIAKA